MTANALLWAIAAVLITAALAGLGWLIRDYLRIRADEGEKDHRIARAEETTKRVGQDVQDSQEVRQSVSNMPDTELDRLLDDKATRAE